MGISEGDLEDETMQRLDRHLPLPKRPPTAVELLEAAERRKLAEALERAMNRANYQPAEAMAA